MCLIKIKCVFLHFLQSNILWPTCLVLHIWVSYQIVWSWGEGLLLCLRCWTRCEFMSHVCDEGAESGGGKQSRAFLRRVRTASAAGVEASPDTPCGRDLLACRTWREVWITLCCCCVSDKWKSSIWRLIGFSFCPPWTLSVSVLKFPSSIKVLWQKSGCGSCLSRD